MPRGRQTIRSNRSTRAKKTGTTVLTVDTFINDKRILDDPPTIIEKAVLLKEYNQEVAAFESILAENFEWFKDLQSKCFNIATENKIRVGKSSLEEAYNTLAAFSTRIIKKEPIEHNDEPMDEPVSSQAIALENAEAFNEKVASIRKDGSPRRQLIRESQIKSEVLTPEVRANSVVKDNIAEEKQEVQRKEEKLKKEKATPSIPPAGRTTRAAKNKATKDAKPPKFMNTIKKEEIDTKLKEAMIRKQQQDLHKVEKTRQLREEKERKVQENLEQKKKEAEQKAEERRKREEAEEELRRMNLAGKSPGRGRFLGSNTNTPSRNGASPYRLVLPRTPGLARVQLFSNSTPRTPGRKPAKLPRVDQLATNIYNAPAHNSPARLVPRKIANGNRPEAMKEVKVEKELIPSAQIHNDEDFRNEQLKLLLQSEESKPLQEHENDQEKIKVEEEVEQKVEEERKKIEESLKRKAAAIKEEEERNKIEDSLRRKEERKAAKRLEEEERLKREEEERKLLEKLKQERAKEEARKQEELRKRDLEKQLKEEEEQKKKLMEERLLKEQLLAEEEKKLIKQEQKPVNKHLLNATQEMDTGSASENSTYEMTQEKIWIPATADNYNIEDLSSGDETDDEGAPRKTVPSWAQWTELYKTTSKMYQDRDRDFDDMFGGMENPHNQPIFNQAKTKKRQRGSSAHWNSPVSNPTKGKSRFLGY